VKAATKNTAKATVGNCMLVPEGGWLREGRADRTDAAQPGR
jgi:hypothetical protein